MEIDFRIEPQGRVLQAYADSRERVQMIRGPLGSGKTTQSCLKIHDYMCSQAPNPEGKRLTRWVAARNTYPELFSTTIKDWLECFGDLGHFSKGGREPPHQLIAHGLPDGTLVAAEIYFIAFDMPDHVKKARGLQLTGIWMNEAKEFSKAVFDMLDLRHGRYPSNKEGAFCTWHGILGDYNSPDDDHWLYELAENIKPKGWAFFVQPGGLIRGPQEQWIENPQAENLNNLPPHYYLHGKEGKTEDWIKVNLANEYGFVQIGKPVHPRYVDSVHCRDLPFSPDRERAIVLGFDFGRTPACAFLQKNSFDSWLCFDEFCADDMSAVSFAPELAKYIGRSYPGCRFHGWGDPSGENKGQATDLTPIKILNDHGIPCRPTPTNDPQTRRAAVELPLREIGMDGHPRLIILPKAKKIRKGLAGAFCYRRIQVAGYDRYTDEPDKNEYSHPVEALEYALQGEGEGREILHGQSDRYSDWEVAVNA